jgi:ABC-2 type transport system ATP-binding protein
MLELINVQKNYGRNPILDIPHLRLDPGIFWLQGPNGAGKTTLLRIIAGILPFKGDIRLLGCSIRKDAIGYRRQVAWGDAEPLYPGFLTGAELLSFYRNILHPEPFQVNRLCSALGIGPWLGTRAAGWSSGMTKKISLLLALLGRPALVALDEPFITLDETGAVALATLIADYHHEFGTSFLLSSHQDIALPDLQTMKIIDCSIRLTV